MALFAIQNMITCASPSMIKTSMIGKLTLRNFAKHQCVIVDLGFEQFCILL